MAAPSTEEQILAELRKTNEHLARLERAVPVLQSFLATSEGGRELLAELHGRKQRGSAYLTRKLADGRRGGGS